MSKPLSPSSVLSYLEPNSGISKLVLIARGALNEEVGLDGKWLVSCFTVKPIHHNTEIHHQPVLRLAGSLGEKRVYFCVE
jgi:hypothetical protein